MKVSDYDRQEFIQALRELADGNGGELLDHVKCLRVDEVGDYTLFGVGAVLAMDRACLCEAMRRRAGLKPTKPRKKRPTAAPKLLTCPVCGTRFETSETRRIACSDVCAKKRRAIKAQARYAAKVVRTVRECAVCGRPFEVSGKSRKLTCSDACAKIRKRERELAWKAATRNGCEL